MSEKEKTKSAAAVRLAERLKLTRIRHPGIILAAVFVGQTMGLVWTHPYQLAYYNAVVGGLNGASWLGFETTYSGDTLSRSLLREVARRVPDGSTIEIAPVLHQFQVEALQTQCPVLNRNRLTLRAYDRERKEGEYLLVFHRRADMPNQRGLKAAGWQVQETTYRQRTVLASFYKRE